MQSVELEMDLMEAACRQGTGRGLWMQRLFLEAVGGFGCVEEGLVGLRQGRGDGLGFLQSAGKSANRMTVLQKEDWKGIVDIVTNAKQFVSSVQDVARRLADYTKFSKMSDDSHISATKDSAPSQKKPDSEAKTIVKLEYAAPEELLMPVTVYFLTRNIEEGRSTIKSRESYTLRKR